MALGSYTKIFICCNHQGKDWLKPLHFYLESLEKEYGVDIWDDTKIKSIPEWREEIKKALHFSGIVLLLVSADFLASDFIQNNELPQLLTAAKDEGLKILSVILSPCRFEQTESLSQFPSVNPPSKPLANMDKQEQQPLFMQIFFETHITLNPFPFQSMHKRKLY